MRRALKRFWFRLRWFLGRALGLFLLLAFLLWLVGPYERVDLRARFDRAGFQGDVDAYFARSEARYGDITPGVQKRVVWAGDRGARTAWAVLYIHGFSATSEEIRPVPDDVAKRLGANLIYTRLKGHGRSGDALARGSVSGWMADVAEVLAAARVVGTRVLVIATSTGGTLMTAVALDERLMINVDGLVLVSPNYGINNPLAPLLTWPAARFWLPPLVGETRKFEPRNAGQARYWTTEYPSVAVMPMAALVGRVATLDHSQAKVPALFWFSYNDQVVRPDATARVARRWGGPVTIVNPKLTEADDPNAHVLAGDIMSPNQTDKMVEAILTWVGQL